MKIYGLFFVIFFGSLSISAQSLQRDFPLSENGSVEIVNLYGRVEITAAEADKTGESTNAEQSTRAVLTAENVRESDLKIVSGNNRLTVSVQPADKKSRIDLILKIPPRMRVSIETDAGEIRLSGNFARAVAKTETGTIAASVPIENLNYDLAWTESRPRFLSDFELKKVKEKAGGKFVISGTIVGEQFGKEKNEAIEEKPDGGNSNDEIETEEKSNNRKPKINDRTPKSVALDFTTARGIILLNVPLNEVSPDLRERPLTDAAKSIIRSGDSALIEAIRRTSPKYFGDYAKTLPPLKREPVLRQAGGGVGSQNLLSAQVKRVLVRVTDLNNRAVAGLQPRDFDVTEAGEKREILSVEPSTAPFNLVLMLDVSGSVDEYVDFIRKAARQFVETADRSDRIAIIIFNEDVKALSTFTADKGKLSESLDTFDAGGGTAFYDALGYALSETLRPLKGERTAIVALTDGDDNRSFLPFDSLLGSIQESGALVYPLYVPSGLIAASSTNSRVAPLDPLRARYMSLSAKAEGEGEKLARISGGVYYPITQISQIQTAYEDIVVQLRTAYSITFRSDSIEMRDGAGASPRLKVKVNRENAFVKLGSVVEVKAKESSEVKAKKNPQTFQTRNAPFQKAVFGNRPIFQTNSFNVSRVNLIKKLFEEARTNKFTIILEHAETATGK